MEKIQEMLKRTGSLAKNQGSLGNLQEGFKTTGLLEREVNCRGLEGAASQSSRKGGRKGREAGKTRVGIRKAASQTGERRQGRK